MITHARHRWIVALLFAATAISYIHRQTLAVVAPELRDALGLSNTEYSRIVFSFLLSYTIMQAVTGWVMDRLGTRRGFALIMAWWSAAAMLHALGQGVTSFSLFRFLLGAGQAGSWAASVRAVTEWFPPAARGSATGVWGAGSSVGAVIAVPLVAWVAVTAGWRSAFVITGAIGFAWLALWWPIYRLPPANVDSEAVAPAPVPVSYRSLLRSRALWGLVLARVFCDPVSWFYFAWVPEYLRRVGGFSMVDVGRYAWIPFLTNGLGIVLGGLLSDRLVRRGWPVVRARVAVMFAGVVMMTAGIAAALPLPVPAVLAAISLTVFGFGFWAPNLMTLCADVFPGHLVGSATGLTGVGAGVGGMMFTLLAGWTIDHFGYRPVFLAGGVMPLVAFTVLAMLVGVGRSPRLKPEAEGVAS